VIPTPREPSGPRAGFGVRLVAWIIDQAVVAVPANVLLLVYDNPGLIQTGAFVAGLAYAILLIGSPSGQTVGMRVVRIRAVDAATGGRIEYGTAAIRFLMSIVSALAIGLGYFWMLLDPEKQTWQDKVAGTYVVPAT